VQFACEGARQRHPTAIDRKQRLARRLPGLRESSLHLVP
jgi:hypothetical protein